MNAVIMSFDPNEKQSVIYVRNSNVSDSVKSAKKALDKLYKACERASETCEQILHRQGCDGKHERVTRQ